jgi:hypothetical protein
MMLRVFSPPVSGTTPAQPYLRDPHARFCKLQLQSSASAQGPNGTALALRDFDLGGAKPILPGGKKRALFSPQSAGLPPREEVRDGPRLPSHSTRPGLPRSFAIRLARRGQAASFMPKTFRQSDTPPPVEPEPDVKELIHANADTLLTRVLARSPSRGPSASPGAASAFA